MFLICLQIDWFTFQDFGDHVYRLRHMMLIFLENVELAFHRYMGT